MDRIADSIDPAPGRTRNFLILLLLGALWGSSYLFIKIGVAEIPALTLVAGRLLLATVILWLLMWVTGQPIPRGRALWGAYAVMGFFSGAVPFSLIAWSEQYIHSGLASLLQSTMPIFTVILAHFLADGERMTPLKVLGVGLGFGGVVVLMLPDLLQGVQASLWGQLAMIVSSISYAAATVFARNRLRGQPPMASATGQLTMAMLFTLPLSLILDRPYDLSPSWAALASWVALAVLGSVLAYILYYSLLERASATFVSTVTYIIPVNGLLLGALVLGEPIGLSLIAGLGLILLGVLLVRA